MIFLFLCLLHVLVLFIVYWKEGGKKIRREKSGGVGGAKKITKIFKCSTRSTCVHVCTRYTVTSTTNSSVHVFPGNIHCFQSRFSGDLRGNTAKDFGLV